MTESDFIEGIDCKFPYRAPLKWRRLNALAPRTSENAAFMVIHELCRPPRSARVPCSLRIEIFEHLIKRFRHPLLSALWPLIVSVMRGETISVSSAAAAMRRVGRYKGQYNMLAVCYFSCNDRNGQLEPLYDSIVRAWSMPNSSFQRTPVGAAEQ